MRIVQEVNSDTTALSLVAGGIGLSFVIQSAERTKPNGVVLKDVGDLRVTAQLFAIWRKDNKAPALQKFIDLIRSEYPDVAKR